MPGDYSLNASEQVVWMLLKNQPGGAVPVEVVAQSLGWRNALELRRWLRQHSLPQARQTIAYCRLTYLAHLISQGIKVEAAISLVGLHNRSSVVLQCMAYFGCYPNDLRHETFAKSLAAKEPHLSGAAPIRL